MASLRHRLENECNSCSKDEDCQRPLDEFGKRINTLIHALFAWNPKHSNTELYDRTQVNEFNRLLRDILVQNNISFLEPVSRLVCVLRKCPTIQTFHHNDKFVKSLENIELWRTFHRFLVYCPSMMDKWQTQKADQAQHLDDVIACCSQHNHASLKKELHQLFSSADALALKALYASFDDGPHFLQTILHALVDYQSPDDTSAFSLVMQTFIGLAQKKRQLTKFLHYLLSRHARPTRLAWTLLETYRAWDANTLALVCRKDFLDEDSQMMNYLVCRASRRALVVLMEAMFDPLQKERYTHWEFLNPVVNTSCQTIGRRVKKCAQTYLAKAIRLDNKPAISLLICKFDAWIGASTLLVASDAQGETCKTKEPRVLSLLEEYSRLETFDVHQRQDAGLRAAAGLGFAHVVTKLLDMGADLHARNDGALMNACRHGHLPVVKELLARGANIHARGKNAAHQAALDHHHSAVAEYLATMMQ